MITQLFRVRLCDGKIALRFHLGEREEFHLEISLDELKENSSAEITYDARGYPTGIKMRPTQ